MNATTTPALDARHPHDPADPSDLIAAVRGLLHGSSHDGDSIDILGDVCSAAGSLVAVRRIAAALNELARGEGKKPPFLEGDLEHLERLAERLLVCVPHVMLEVEALEEQQTGAAAE